MIPCCEQIILCIFHDFCTHHILLYNIFPFVLVLSIQYLAQPREIRSSPMLSPQETQQFKKYEDIENVPKKRVLFSESISRPSPAVLVRVIHRPISGSDKTEQNILKIKERKNPTTQFSTRAKLSSILAKESLSLDTIVLLKNWMPHQVHCSIRGRIFLVFTTFFINK